MAAAAAVRCLHGVSQIGFDCPRLKMFDRFRIATGRSNAEGVSCTCDSRNVTGNVHREEPSRAAPMRARRRACFSRGIPSLAMVGYSTAGRLGIALCVSRRCPLEERGSRIGRRWAVSAGRCPIAIRGGLGDDGNRAITAGRRDVKARAGPVSLSMARPAALQASGGGLKGPERCSTMTAGAQDV